MNAVEHIVEAYFRSCRGCFTQRDVKVIGGNNRQLDILAVSLLTGDQYHIECSVTHGQNWCPTPQELVAKFEKKFSGIPVEKEGENTDFAKGKHYGGQIGNAYARLGLDPGKIKRVWICWLVKGEAEELSRELYGHHMRTGQQVEILSFRDEVLPQLIKEVSTSNYDDEILRTLSLVKEQQRQTQRILSSK